MGKQNKRGGNVKQEGKGRPPAGKDLKEVREQVPQILEEQLSRQRENTQSP